MIRVVLFVGCLTVLGACGSRPIEQVVAQRGSQKDGAVLNEPSADAQSFFRSVSEQLSLLQGSPGQRQLGERRRTDAQQAAYGACMADNGFAYAMPTIVPSLQDSATNTTEWWLAPNVDLSKQIGFGFYSNSPDDYLPKISTDSTAYDALTPDDRADYDATLSSCLEAVDQRVLFEGPLNPAASVLEGALVNDFRERMKEPDFVRISEMYQTCMTDLGHKVTAPGASFDAMQNEVAAAVPGGANQFTEPGRTKGLEIERVIAVDDATCRLAHTDQVVAILAPVFTSWATANSTDISAANEAWDVAG